MQITHVDPSARGFHVVATTQRSQAATMVLSDGASTGSADNRHATNDQWLFVVSGSGRATVEGVEVELETGALLVIEAGEGHEIASDPGQDLVTLNVYAPPVY